MTGAATATPSSTAEPAHGPLAGRSALFVLCSIVSVQTGAGFAGRLFDDVGPGGVVMLRQGLAAVVLAVAVRPRLRGRAARESGSPSSPSGSCSRR
ncbi:MAG: hypothetical protein R2705_15580 [Ilumatobacteraceae bacterium]